MVGDLDPDALDLCVALCTRAGMLFEDASPKAILVRNLTPEELLSAIREAQEAAEQAGALLAAAELLASGAQT